MAKVALFEWTAGGHRPIYVRRLVDALAGSADLLLALPDQTLAEVEDLDVECLPLGSARPPLGSRFARRAILAEEVERLRDVASRADQVFHLFGDHVLFELAKAKRLHGALSLLLYYPRWHYPSTYGTSLPLADRAVALAKEWAIRRWRRRSDSRAVFVLDEELARRWSRPDGAPAYWLPEPPVAVLDTGAAPVRAGCVVYGALAERKGIDRLTRALSSRPTTIRTVLAGVVEPGYEAELDRSVKAMESVGVNVEVRASRHSEQEGLRVLASACCAVLPYPRHPGMSRVLLEACSVGTPVVADNFGLLGHLVRTWGLGLTVDSSDPDELREAVLQVSAGDEWMRYSDRLARFTARFTPERFRAALVSGLRLRGPAG